MFNLISREKAHGHHCRDIPRATPLRRPPLRQLRDGQPAVGRRKLAIDQNGGRCEPGPPHFQYFCRACSQRHSRSPLTKCYRREQTNVHYDRDRETTDTEDAHTRLALSTTWAQPSSLRTYSSSLKKSMNWPDPSDASSTPSKIVSSPHAAASLSYHSFSKFARSLPLSLTR